MAAFFALLALIFGVLLILAATYYLQVKGDLRKSREETTQVKQKAQSALARYKGIVDLEKYKSQLTNSVAQLKQSDTEWGRRISEQESTLSDLVTRAEAVEDTLDMQSFGFYRPKYGFEDSERYAHKLGEIRDEQGAMVKADEATHCPQQWTVDGAIVKSCVPSSVRRRPGGVRLGRFFLRGGG